MRGFHDKSLDMSSPRHLAQIFDHAMCRLLGGVIAQFIAVSPGLLHLSLVQIRRLRISLV